MKVLLTIWISAVLIQEVIPSTLVRLPRQAPKQSSSLVHTEYEAKYEKRGKHGNDSSGLVSGKQEIIHDNCSENWNAFADKCASLIKDLVASLANAVSSRPGDATKLQLQIKNTFRHFDNTHNCTCLNQTGSDFPHLDLSPLFNNLTISTIAPTLNDNNGDSPGDKHQSSCGGNGQSCDGENGDGHTEGFMKPRQPNPALSNAEKQGVSPEEDGGPEATNNNRRQAKYPQMSWQPSYTGKPNNIKTSPYPFIVTPQPNSYTGPLDALPHSAGNIPPIADHHDIEPGLKSENGNLVPVIPVINDNHDGKLITVVPVIPVTDGHSDSRPETAATVPNGLNFSPNSFANKGSTNVPQLYPGTGPATTEPVLNTFTPEDNTPQNNHAVVVPVINSDSHLPESEGPESHGATTNYLPTSPGPNPSSPNVKKVNYGIPEAFPPSTDASEWQTVTPTTCDSCDPHPTFSSVNNNQAVPNADNHQLGPVSSPSDPGILTTVETPSSDCDSGKEEKENCDSGKEEKENCDSEKEEKENCDSEGENGSGNENTTPSQHLPVTVYPVYRPSTSSPLDHSTDGGQQNGSESPENDCSGSTSCSEHEGNGSTVPTPKEGCSDGESSDSDAGCSSTPVTATDNFGKTPAILYPEQHISTLPQPEGQSQEGSGSPAPNHHQGFPGGEGNGPQTGAVSDPNMANGNDGTTPAFVYTERPVVESHQGTVNPPINAGPVPSQSGSTPSIVAVPAIPVSPISTTGVHDAATKPVLVDPSLPSPGPILVPITTVPQPESHQGTVNPPLNAGPVPSQSGSTPIVAIPAIPVSAISTTGAHDAATTPVLVDPSIPSSGPILGPVTTVAPEPYPGTDDLQSNTGSGPDSGPGHHSDGDSDFEKPTTFQTTSSNPTSPQSILLPTESSIPLTQHSDSTSVSPHHDDDDDDHDHHGDDDDDEDCCTCESCTEEDISDPKQYKENACKNLEEARRELKAIFDKIRKKLKCGRKAPQAITST